MSITQLRSFVEVYRQRSVSRAANALGLTQPAVSGRIASLETQIERELFTRHPRGMEPTGIADELAARVSEAMDCAEKAPADVKVRSLTLSGTIHIRGPSDILFDRIVERSRAVVAGGLAIQPHPVDQKKLRTMLLEGRADFAFAAPPPDDPRIETSLFGEEELLLIRAPEVKAKIAVFNQLPEAMQSVPFVAYDRLQALIDMWTEANSLSLDRAIESLTAPDLRGLRNFVVKGFGWSAPPRDLVAAELLSGALEAMSPPHRNPVIAYHMLRLKSSMRTPEQRGRCCRVSRISGHRRRCSRRRLAASPAARRNGLRAEGRRRKS